VTVSVVLEVDGVDRLIGGLQVAPDVLEAATREAMEKSVATLEAAVKSGTPRVTGRLFSSINGRVTGTGSDLRGAVGTAVSYAPYVESGRGPIVAHGKALRFRGRDGRMIYRRSVGPAAGRHMFAIGLRASVEPIRGFFRDAAKRTIDAIRNA
jgi:hypothetical protein